MLQQLGGLWRWLQEQSPALRVVLFAAPVVVVALLVLGGLMVWSVTRPIAALSPTPVPAVQPNPTAAPPVVERTVIAIATATALPTPPPPPATPVVLVPGRDGSPAPIASPTLTPTPEPARSARIANTDGQGANMRRSPSVSAQRVKVIPEGNIVELIGGEQRGDGFTWRNIRDVDGSTGFVTVDYLQLIQGAPGAPPVLPPPSIQVEEITSPAVRGKEATLKIVTRPGARCELRVLLYGPSEMPTSGLGVQKADADGFCTWTWTVPEETLPGVWRYRISAGEGEGRATREVSIVIT